MSAISTHVLDVSLGRPAAGVTVTLELRDNDGWTELSTQLTDSDGRVKQLLLKIELGTFVVCVGRQ